MTGKVTRFRLIRFGIGYLSKVHKCSEAKPLNFSINVWMPDGRCLSLKGSVVGRSDEQGVQLPPLHPRCRCTIQYRELTGKPKDNPPAPKNPLTSPSVGGNVTVKPQALTPRQKIIRDAEEKAYLMDTGADFGFKSKNAQAKWKDEIVVVNPTKGAQGFERTMNCQRCVVAHEARMRGYDVIARATWGIDDPMLTVREWLKVFSDEGKEIYRCQGTTVAEIENFIVGKMKDWGKGSRAFIWFEWDNAIRSNIRGHVIVAQLNERGLVDFGDPQRRKIGAVRYLNETKLDSVKIMRVDKLKFTDLVKKCCVNKE